MHPPTQMLVGASPSLFKRMPDWPEDLQPKFCGDWTIPQNEQIGGPVFFSSAFGGDLIPYMRRFIESGDPPVYIGWGPVVAQSGQASSMTGQQHMACLAVRALMQTNMRGIILSGGAGL